MIVLFYDHVGNHHFFQAIIIKKSSHVSRLTGIPCNSVEMQHTFHTLLYCSRPRYMAGLGMFEGCKKFPFDPFLPSFAFHLEASHLICSVNQMIGFYMKSNTEMKWVKSTYRVLKFFAGELKLVSVKKNQRRLIPLF